MTPAQCVLIAEALVPLAPVVVNHLRIDLAALLMALMFGIVQLAGMGMLGGAGHPTARGLMLLA